MTTDNKKWKVITILHRQVLWQITWARGLKEVAVQSTVILRTALFCSGGMRGHPAGVRRTDNAQREPSDGEVQPVSRGVPSEMFQHEVDRQHPELQRRLVAESLCHEIGENHPSPHSFIPGLKLSFSANSSQRSLPFLLHDWLDGFPRLFTDTSELIRFYFLLFLFFLYFLVVGSVRYIILT